MQDDAGANSGERNAEHQGDEIFVHGGFPWRWSSAAVLDNSPVAVSTISQSPGNVSYLTPDSSANSWPGISTEQPFRNEAACSALKPACSGLKPSLIFQRSPDLSA
jgi:hypothetical protein